MTLLNGLLALGALAFTIPLAIHLLFRSRFRTVNWGAMHLLDDVVRVNRRRIELMNLLLLLLRCLLPILLAFCLARPVLTGFRSLPGDAARTVVVAIDDSRSMAARDADGQTRMHHVSVGLAKFFETLSRRDEVILVRTSSIDAVVGSMGTADAIEQTGNLTATGGPVDLGRLVRRAVDVSGDAAHPQRQIVVVSDFQSHMVGDSAIESLKRLEKSLSEQEIRPTISFLNVGDQSSTLDNVFVESIESDSPAVVAGRSAKFSARIRNSTDHTIRDLRLAWTVAGRPLDTRTITLPPRSSTVTRLTHTIDMVGVHPISVSIEHSDALPDDNERIIAVDVIREINVLMVNGSPSNRPLEGETDFLAIALSPFAFGGQDQPDAVRNQVTTKSAAIAEIDKQSPDIVVLANVDDISGDLRSRLASFVRSGGSLVVFDGDKLKPESYNEVWGDSDDGWQLPARLGDGVGGPRADNDDVPRYSIGQLNNLYAPWSIIGAGSGADASSGPIGEIAVTGYRKLSVVETETETATATKLLSFSSGDPLVVRARRGKGQVIQFAIPCDASWSNLPLRLVFLPMMQQLVLDLAGSQKQTTVDVGSPIDVAVSELTSQRSADSKIDSKAKATYSYETPDRVEAAIQPYDDDEVALLRVSRATMPGVYQFRQHYSADTGDPIVNRTIRVAEVPAVESQLRDADESRLNRAAELVSASVYRDLDSLQSDDQTRRFGREIWRWLLVALLVGLVGELLLQQRRIGLRKSPLIARTGQAAGAR
ncbi:MAG: BatA domain-containing protein [Rubripirellula sp.]